jgi:hypothetical protein
MMLQFASLKKDNLYDFDRLLAHGKQTLHCEKPPWQQMWWPIEPPPILFFSIPLSYMNTYTIAMHQKKYEKTNAFF